MTPKKYELAIPYAPLAIQWDGSQRGAMEIADWVNSQSEDGRQWVDLYPQERYLNIQHENGGFCTAEKFDYVVLGKEFHVEDPHIFEMMYREA